VLIKIRSEFEKSLKKAMPEFRRYSARVSRLSMEDLPCLNVYFHRDVLLEQKNFHDLREVLFVVEACTIVGEDAEAELVDIYERIRTEIEQNESFQKTVAECVLHDIDFGHEMIGEKRIAALEMTFHVRYQKPSWQPAVPGIPKEVWINGEKQNA
jgi:hypothetical protein